VAAALAPTPCIKAFRVRSREDLPALGRYQVQGYLLDAFVAGRPGGTGARFDWGILEGFEAPGPLILSGGLTPENVAEAVRRVRPYAVDVSSGVEAEPGRKDHALLKRFIEEALSVA
jgi:phosphoribosylanthranilate isomerase